MTESLKNETTEYIGRGGSLYSEDSNCSATVRCPYCPWHDGDLGLRLSAPLAPHSCPESLKNEATVHRVRGYTLLGAAFRYYHCSIHGGRHMSLRLSAPVSPQRKPPIVPGPHFIPPFWYKSGVAQVSDPINPQHYRNGRQEAILTIEDALEGAPSPQAAFLQGQCLKYLLRLWHKGNSLQDAKKAQWYLTRLIDRLEAKEE